MTAFRPVSPADRRRGHRVTSQSHRPRPSVAHAQSTTSSGDVLLRDELDTWGLVDLERSVSITHFGPRTRRALTSILVPLAGGPNSEIAIGVAVELAQYWNASLALLTVVSPSGDESVGMEADARLHNYADSIDTVPVDTHVCTHENVVGAITERARDHDLVVIGGSERSLFRRLFSGTVPKQLAERSETPMFVVENDTR